MTQHERDNLIQSLIQEYADNQDDFDIHKCVAAIIDIVAPEGKCPDRVEPKRETLACAHCGHKGADVTYFRIGGELPSLAFCVDNQACASRNKNRAETRQETAFWRDEKVNKAQNRNQDGIVL